MESDTIPADSERKMSLSGIPMRHFHLRMLPFSVLKAMIIASLQASLQFATQERLGCALTVAVTVAALVFLLSVSAIAAVLILTSYVFGLCSAAFIVKLDMNMPNILPVSEVDTPSVERLFPRRRTFSACAVCGGEECRRRRASGSTCCESVLRQPWKDLKIPSEVDTAVGQFLDKVVTEFIATWYSTMSSDKTFVTELCQLLRHVLSLLLRRLLCVDINRAVLERGIPLALSHLDTFLYARQFARKHNISIDEAVIRCYGNRLHHAVHSRPNELRYLAELSDMLVNRLAPPKTVECKSWHAIIREVVSRWVLLSITDAVADPDILNQLIVIIEQHITEPTELKASEDLSGGTDVEFLEAFVKSSHEKWPSSTASVLHTDLSNVMQERSLLYSFMQFLKAEGNCVHILQFCLDADSLGQRVLQPELTYAEKSLLHAETKALYQNYFAADAVDKVDFDKDIVDEICQIVSHPPEDIVALQKCTALFRAYETAYNLLETVYCPLFFSSDYFYHLLVGSRLSEISSSTNKIQTRGDGFGATARLTTRLRKLKGMLHSSPVDGRIFGDSGGYDYLETEYGEELSLTDDGISYAEDSLEATDLSAWRVSIPRVETRLDGNGRPGYVFIIDIHRIDVRNEDDQEECHWTVERKHPEFYLLEAKLTEFHGEFPDAHLPPKRSLFSVKSLEFMEGRRQPFEDYLQRLLQKPSLKGSQLLTSFLTSRGEFSSTLPPDTQGLGVSRMIRTVPLKLTRERGQHLDSFVNIFFTSTEPPKPRPSKLEWMDANWEDSTSLLPSSLSHRWANPTYGNNLGINEDTPSGRFDTSSFSVDGVYEVLLYLGKRVWNIRWSFIQLLLALKSVLQNSVNYIGQRYIRRKLAHGLAPARLAKVIHLLDEAVFGRRGTPTTSSLRKERSERAFQSLKKLETLCKSLFFAWPFSRNSTEVSDEGVALIFEALQQPHLNKQVVYTLLDSIALELFSELSL